jgi:predicted outer membrane repeat protein
MQNGALLIQDGLGESLIQDSTLTDNSNDKGGALTLINSGNVSITGTTFSQNTATTSGGAIFYQCPNCELNISGCSFLNNQAAVEGGAIKWTQSQPLLDSATKLTGNQAWIYSPVIAGPPIRIVLLNQLNPKPNRARVLDNGSSSQVIQF